MACIVVTLLSKWLWYYGLYSCDIIVNMVVVLWSTWLWLSGLYGSGIMVYMVEVLWSIWRWHHGLYGCDSMTWHHLLCCVVGGVEWCALRGVVVCGVWVEVHLGHPYNCYDFFPDERKLWLWGYVIQVPHILTLSPHVGSIPPPGGTLGYYTYYIIYNTRIISYLYDI